MNYQWLNKKSNPKLIIFFNGWGMDANPTKHLSFDDFDIIMFNDYRDLNIEQSIIESINSYEHKTLISWSMGVWAATQLNIGVTQSIAINGTLMPIDDKFGIPVNVYNTTLELMNEQVRDKFFTRMFYSKDELIKFRDNLPKRLIENQKEELASLKEFITNRTINSNKHNTAIIANRDKIIPTKNQLNFWQGKAKIKQIDTGHCPFYSWKSWSEIIEYANES